MLNRISHTPITRSASAEFHSTVHQKTTPIKGTLKDDSVLDKKAAKNLFSFYCAKAKMLNQFFTSTESKLRLFRFCDGIIETLDINNHLESGFIGVIFLTYSPSKPNTYPSYVHDIYQRDGSYHIHVNTQHIKSQWLHAPLPLLLVLATPPSLFSRKKSTALYGITLTSYFQKHGITHATLNNREAQKKQCLSILINTSLEDTMVSPKLLETVKHLKNQFFKTRSIYFDKEKVCDSAQQIGRLGELFVCKKSLDRTYAKRLICV